MNAAERRKARRRPQAEAAAPVQAATEVTIAPRGMAFVVEVAHATGWAPVPGSHIARDGALKAMAGMSLCPTTARIVLTVTG